MIPIALNPATVSMAVAGRGPAAVCRLLRLRIGGARDVLLFSDDLSPELECEVGPLLCDHLPDRMELDNLRVLWIVGLPDGLAADQAALAESARVLVNVEDRPPLCDFHSVAEVRRGDLLLTVSTGGASPGLAARIRARLAEKYGPEWGDHLALLRGCRAVWRAQGGDVTALTDVLLEAKGWLT